MSIILDKLLKMRDRIPMYIGDNSLLKLAAYIRGYEQALIQHGIETNDDFLRDFDCWIRKRLHVKLSRAWEEIIIFYGGNDKDSIDFFWKLLDEYIEKKT